MSNTTNSQETLSTVFSRIIEELGKMDKRIDAAEQAVETCIDTMEEITELLQNIKERMDV